MLADILRPLAASNATTLAAWVTVLVDLSLDQRALLIYGEVDGVRPENISMRNGIAYLEGWDTFADMGQQYIPYGLKSAGDRSGTERDQSGTERDRSGTERDRTLGKFRLPLKRCFCEHSPHACVSRSLLFARCDLSIS